jgi:putative heme iron utilization protein
LPYEILSDLVCIEDILLIVKNSSATSEIKTNNLKIQRKEKWFTIGSNDDPAHLHINSDMIKSIEFIQEEKPRRTSFSVRFFDETHERVIVAFFTKMYDQNKNLKLSRKTIFGDLQKNLAT